MPNPEQNVVVGVFKERAAGASAIRALLQAGFPEDQVGFAARTEQATPDRASDKTVETTEEHPSRGRALVRGIVGGIMGALDILLVPITGPTDASTILASTLPITENAIDHLPHLHVKHDIAPIPPIQQETEDKTLSGVTQYHASEQGEQTGVIAGGVIGGLAGAAVALLIPGIGPVVAGGLLATILGSAAVGGVAGGFLGTFEDMGVSRVKAQQYEQDIKSGSVVVTVKTDRQQDARATLLQYGAHDVEIH